ncbi:AraC family transcriptional regulator [Agrobacterium rosae]|uniref:AraC family transcriptional regulator n=2 Tax=Agrobacterium rosae TaxID=1972867 RepID=A0AAE5VMS0_9HYPH|nr:helix-turn-helix domain-containing protein [Agrobacterium rosae]POO49370.1 AraC family transcriptional regulator [Agrobacterium rosae]
MDISAGCLHYLNIRAGENIVMQSVPTYMLYGENARKEPDFWVHCETIQSRSSRHGWEIRLHRHESFFQILYLESGSGDAMFGDGIVPILPPAVVSVPVGFNHGFRFSRDVRGLVLTVLNTHLGHGPGERSGLLLVPLVTRLDIGQADGAYVAQTLTRLADEFDNRRLGRGNLLAAYISSTLQLLTRISSAQTAEQPFRSDKASRIEALRALIQQHFRAHKPVAFYARSLDVSLTHLNRIVRSALGCTAHDLIAEKLMEESKAQLLFSVAPVSEIAAHLGFADPAYFSRFFLSRAGEPPRVWRLREQARLENS